MSKFLDEDLEDHQPFPTLQKALETVPQCCGFNIEVKWTMLLKDGTYELDHPLELNHFMDLILKVCSYYLILPTHNSYEFSLVYIIMPKPIISRFKHINSSKQKKYCLYDIFHEFQVVLDYADHRKIVFSCFHPDICTMLRLKQNRYPVMFLTQAS